MQRRGLVLTIMLLAAGLAVAGVAWACAPAGSLTLSQTSGPPGTQVIVSASGYPNGATVGIYWDSLSGDRLGQGIGPSFNKAVTIPPSATSGTHYLVAAATDANGAHSHQVPAAFTVTSGSSGSSPSPSSRPGSSSTPFPLINPFASAPAPGGKTLNGTAAGETLVGTPYGDVISCGAGNDVVRGGGGNDVISCGAGDDRVNGGPGNDRVAGGPGRDRLAGAAGKDRLSGGAGNDRLLGGGGVDVLRGGKGKDRLSGGAGRDLLFRDVRDVLSGASRDRVR